MTGPCAPVALFAYNRPRHLARTLRALAANPLAARTPVVAYADGPRGPADEAAVGEVRAVLARARGFASLRVVPCEANLGLARNIIAGVGETLAAHGRVIVLEDDLLTTPGFLEFMNRALDAYQDEERVAAVHGYVLPVPGLPETFMLRMTDCWGWGTWSRAWKLFEPDGAGLLARLRAAGLTRTFDLDGAQHYTAMLEDQIAGRNDSWAVRWYASTFLAGRLGLYPGRSLVRNIGLDGSGTHGADTRLDAGPCVAPARFVMAQPREDAAARKAIVRHLGRSRPGLLRRLRAAARRLLAPEARP
ncbi:sugar transferase [Desulfocurvus sp.]|uniref:sugar transferase n=1 Tax=Desulfocurvus sp. TaxID=2871698 RepID=UPI0025BA5628|nr:sugar transferase [Desulfocurvus sp.]MCK9238811.1 sugar transferase [Desulfocurvus sp.]